MRFYFTILFIPVFFQLTFGQSQSKTDENDLTNKINIGASCSHNHERSPADLEAEKRSFLAWKIKQLRLRSASVLRTVPIVFHLIEDTARISDQDVEVALASLNNAFSHSHNNPIGQDFGDGVIGVNTQIQFCMARRAPDGGRTNGIVRWTSDYFQMDMDLEDAKLKTMGQWDPRYYLNVYVVDRIDAELFASYTGRTWWTRYGLGGYASGPGGVVGQDARTDGVVVSGLGAGLLAHEIGHYLSLLHTFAGGCKNDDCLIDGDMVCDTPPDNTFNFGGCPAGSSCDTDTLSNYSNGNFPVDVPDMVTNFMDYSTCPRDFSQGQADRMIFTLDNYRINLAVEAPSNNDACTSPCNDSVNVSFTISERYRNTNVPITFDASGNGIDTYEWYLERLGGTGSDYTMAWLKGYVPTDTLAGTGPQFTATMADPGKYRIYLKAWNSANPDCFASYSRVIRVTCEGIDARFFPDVRLIASKQDAGKLLDKVVFTNRSDNATSYEWTVEHFPYDGQLPAQPIFKSDSVDLIHTFLEPGDYEIGLIAQNGTCTDTIGPFLLPVEDPTIDARIKINRVDCYKEDSLRLEFTVFNDGYDTMRVGFPISFYDEDPLGASPTPNNLGTFYTDRLVYGRDDSEGFTFIVPASVAKLDQIWALVNDTTTTSFPIVWPNHDNNVMSVNSEFPPSTYNELNYDNNGSRQNNYQFNIRLGLDGPLNCTDQEIGLIAAYANTRRITDVTWIPENRLSCTDCLDPIVQLPRNDTTTQTVILTSEYFCIDTATFILPEIGTLVPRPTVSAVPELCPGNQSLDLSNFVNGVNLTWYSGANSNDANSSAPTMNTSTPGTYRVFVSQTIDNCEGLRQELTYVVKDSPTGPTIADQVVICEGEAAPNLNSLVSGNNLQWYDAQNGGQGQNTAPIINTDNAVQFNFWVTQAANGCESERVRLPIEVRGKSAIPQVNNIADICPGTTAPDLGTQVSGTNLLWYNSASGGNGMAQAPNTSTQNPGAFAFWVSQTENGCESPRTEVSFQVLQVPAPPQVDAIMPICAGAELPDLQQAVSGTNLLWYGDEMGGTGNNQVPNIDRQQAGTYSFWLSQTVQGCESERNQLTFSIKPRPDLPLLQGDPRFCRNSTAQPLGNYIDGNNLSWYVNQNDTSALTNVPQIETSQAESNSFWISQTENGCEGPRIELAYEVLELPSTPTIDAIDAICQGAPAPNLGDFVSGLNLLWYPSETGGAGSDNVPITSTDNVGTYSFWLSQSDANCRSPRAQISYEVLAPPEPPQIIPIANLCEGDARLALDQQVIGNRLKWYAQNSDSVELGSTPVMNTTNAGLFQWWVSQSDDKCESEKALLTYQINDTPDAPLITTDPSICEGDVAPDLSDFIDGINLKWYTSANSLNSSDSPPQVNTDSAGLYSYWFSQSLLGCEGARTRLDVKVIGLEIIPFGPYLVPEGSSELIEAEVLITPSDENYQTLWLDPQGSFIASNANSVEITPEEDGIYKIQVEAANCRLEAEVLVEILFQLDATRLFSPNGDGANDFWYIGDIEQFPDAKVNVFNRWGDMVYQAQPYLNDWDGTDQQGRQLPMGTYYYVIDLNDNNRKPISGSITIKR